VRPENHDEFERYIVSAYPYYFAVGTIMVGTQLNLASILYELLV